MLEGFMVLMQLNIAGNLVQWAFVIVLAGLSVAFAVTFGVGDRDFARKVMGYWGGDIDRARELKPAQEEAPCGNRAKVDLALDASKLKRKTLACSRGLPP